MVSPAVQLPIPKERREAVTPLNLGVFLGRPAIHVPKGGMSDCLNVRVKDGTTRNENFGWDTFPIGETPVNVDGEQVLLIDQFFKQTGTQTLILGTKKDLFRFDATNNLLKYLSPQYGTGTVSVIGAYPYADDDTLITGNGTLWDTDVLSRANADVGDYIHFGDADYVDQDATWYEIKEVISNTSLVVHGDASGESTGVYTIRQCFQGTEFDAWSTDVFINAQPSGEDRWFATQGTDPPVYWNTTDDTSMRFDPGFTCRVLRLHKNMLLYGDLVESGVAKPSAVRNSDVANPQDVTNGLASEFTSTDAIDGLMELTPIGDVMAAYHERSINLLQFVGLPYIFVIRTSVPGIGPLSPGAIMDFGDFHEFLAADAAYEFNGVGIKEIGPHVFHEALRRMSPDRIFRITTHIDEENGDAHWVIPLISDAAEDEYAGPKTAFTEHYLEDASLGGDEGFTPITIRDLPATATGYYERSSTLTFDGLIIEWENFNYRWNDRFLETTFPLNLFGTEDGYIYVISGATDQISGASTPVAVNSFARFRRFPMLNGHMKGLAKRVTPYVKERTGATVDLTIKLYGADAAHRTSVLKDTKTMALDYSDGRFVSCRKMMRYMELELGTNAIGGHFELAGYDVLIQEGPER
jgi:hypothetical protein